MGKSWKRLRAHVNPLSASSVFEEPIHPSKVDWAKFFPMWTNDKIVRFADVGCGFGGLLEALAPKFPDKCILGMEIRIPVVSVVENRIQKLQQESPQVFDSIGVVNANSMKHFVKFFSKAQLEKLFFCFPDPHFKRSNHRRRIVSSHLLDEYAYVLSDHGRLYSITDVKDLHDWTVGNLEEHSLFQRVSDEEVRIDPAVPAMFETDESKKVTRLGGEKFVAVYERVPRQH